MAFAVWILASVFVAAGANRCDVSHVRKCLEPQSSWQMDVNNPEQSCKTLGDVKTCLEALKARCPGLRANIDSGLAGVNQQHSTYCSTTGCPAVKLMKCSNMMANLKMDSGPNKESCESLSKAIQCFDQVLLTCPDGPEKNMHTQQLNMLKMQGQMCSAMTSGGDGPPSGDVIFSVLLASLGVAGETDLRPSAGCPPDKLLKCSRMMDNLKMEAGPTKESCESLSMIIQCFDQVLLTCPDGPEKNMHTQQLNILKMQGQMCSAMTSGGDGPISGGQICGQQGMIQCQMMMQAATDPSDIAANCKALGDSKTCYEQLSANCGESPFKDNIKTAVTAVRQQWDMACDASPTGCSAPNLGKCTSMMQAEVKNDSPTVAKCDTLIQAVQCLQAMRPSCESVMASSIDQLLSSVQPQYQICVQLGKEENEQNSATAASSLGSKPQTSKPMGNKPGKPGAAGKKTTPKPDSDETKKPKGDEDNDDEVKSEGKEAKFEDDKKSPNTGGNGSSLVTASFLVTVIAVGILALAQWQF